MSRETDAFQEGVGKVRHFDVVTQRDVIRGVADAWRAQYPENRVLVGGEESDSIWQRLKALNLEVASVGDVAGIIGHPGWTRLVCYTCKTEGGPLAHFVDGDYEAPEVNVCAECLRAALAALHPEVQP